MKRILSIVLAITALAACTPKEPGYAIKGQADDLNGQAVLAYQLPDGTNFADTVAMKAGAFTFKGSVPEALSATLTLLPEGGEPGRAGFYVENVPITVNVNTDAVVDYAQYGGLSYSDVKVEGGVDNAFTSDMDAAVKAVGERPEFQEIAAAERALRNMGYADMAAYQAASQAFSQKFADISGDYSKARMEAIKACIAAHPESGAALYMYDVYNSDATVEEFEEGFNQFSDAAKNSFLAKDAREELAARKATAPGAVAPDFTLNDPEGNPVTLSSLRGQYVIVDFWASWCKPCRAGVPAMKELYKKYHPKGLEIIGVSDDTSHDAWKKAIEQDQTPWIHVCDEFPIENKPARVGSAWGVHYIPSYFLLAKEGKIIGKMDHEELEAKLAELLD